MAKKIRFSLEMQNHVLVGNIEELQENFSLERILVYLENGKLIRWLKDRYLNELAEKVMALDLKDKDLSRKICEIFEVDYDVSSEIDMELAAERNRKIALLKEYGYSFNEYWDVIDQIAFEQDDIYDLLDRHENVIYLCGKRFHIPLSVKHMEYHGINSPVVVVDSKREVDWEELDIQFTNIVFDEKYQAVLKGKETKKESSYKIIKKRIEEKDIYEGCICFTDEKGTRYSIISVLVNVNTGEEIHHEVVEFAEDNENVYFLCGSGWEYINQSGIYNKQTKEKKIFSIENNMEERFLSFRTFKVRPENKRIGITEQKIYSYKDEGIYQSNHDGTDLMRIYGIQPKKYGRYNNLWKTDCIFIHKNLVYYAKANGDEVHYVPFGYWGSLTVCVFDINTGEEKILHQRIHKIAIYHQFMYLLEEKETELLIYQLRIETSKCQPALYMKNESHLLDFYVRNDYLMYETSAANERIVEIDADYGILSKEKYETVGFIVC